MSIDNESLDYTATVTSYYKLLLLLHLELLLVVLKHLYLYL